jgi:ZIP family zinc transporter
LIAAIPIYILVPSGAFCLGSLWAVLRSPGPKLNSAVQHLAAGLIFAAVAVELLPQEKGKSPLMVVVGFAVGTLFMLLLEVLVERVRSNDKGDRESLSFVAVVGVDITIDGLLIGLAFTLGSKQGVLVTSALAVEFLSLGLTSTAAIAERLPGNRRRLALAAGLALLPVAGALVGVQAFAGFSPGWISFVTAFAIAALMFLVTEELLREAHKLVNTHYAAAMFFIGFLVIFVIDLVA